MTRAINRAAERLTESAILTAAARLMMAFGVPVTLAFVGWLLVTVLALMDARADLLRRLDQVERAATQAAADDRAVAARLGAVEAGQARLEARQEATSQLTLRALGRIENQIDNQRRP